MRVLLDTCAFIWLDATERNRFGDQAFRFLEGSEGELLLSAASIWEISIKVSIGKLKLRTSLEEALREKTETRRLRVLPVTATHALKVQDLPFHHRDPFDRLLIAQVLSEGIPIITPDSWFDTYGVTRLWD